MHEAMNLKLRGSRRNIDILKLKMLSLILTKQRARVYGATAAWKHSPYFKGFAAANSVFMCLHACYTTASCASCKVFSMTDNDLKT